MSRLERPEPMTLLRRELRRMRWSERASREFAYRGGADFVLRHGVEYAPRQLPERFRHAAPGLCYANAISASIVYGVEYVEGYALDPDLQKVFAHAWNADEGGVIDTTWTGEVDLRVADGKPTLYVGKPGAAYLGVRFSSGRADDATWFGDASLLDDRNRGWPLFREEWRGEDFSLEWTPSPPAQRLMEVVDVARELGLPVEEAARDPRGMLLALGEMMRA